MSRDLITSDDAVGSVSKGHGGASVSFLILTSNLRADWQPRSYF